MKIAYYSVSPLTPSGYGNCTRELVYRLLDEHEVDVFAYHGLQNSEITVALDGQEGERPVKIVGGTGSVWHPILAENAHKYDVVVSHFDMWMLSVNPSNNLVERIPQSVINWGIIDSAPIAFPVRRMVNSRNFLSIVPMTEWAERELKICPDIPLERVVSAIPHGIDLEEWKPVKNPRIPNIPDDAFCVVTVCPNMGMRECIPLMIEGFAKFIERTGADAYYYVHSSPFPEPGSMGYKLREVIRAVEEVTGVDLKDRIFFKSSAGRLPEDFMRSMYSRADVLLNPVSGSLEIPCLEAASCDTPSVGLDFAGTGEILANDRGWLLRGYPMYMNLSSVRQLFPLPDDIAEALEAYYNDPKLRKKHAGNLKGWIERNATWDKVAEKWKEMLVDVEASIMSYDRAYFCGRDVSKEEWQHFKVDGKVLELGCGLGDLMEHLNNNGCQVTGIEISDYALATCRERGLDVMKSNAEELPFADNSFDWVISQHVLEHCDWMKALEESMRVAKKGIVHIVPGHPLEDMTHKKSYFDENDMKEITEKVDEWGDVFIYPEGQIRDRDWVIKGGIHE